MPRTYHHLSEEEQRHFVEHGWLRVPKAIRKDVVDDWMRWLWPRLGMDPNDPSTWNPEYVTMPPHHEMRNEELCPEAWNKCVELVGGEELINPVRDRYWSDQFHVNFGTPEEAGKQFSRADIFSVHCDNDFYRLVPSHEECLPSRWQFLDSGECVLTVILAFTDATIETGATLVFEKGIKQVCETWYNHPEGAHTPYYEPDIKPFRGLTETAPTHLECKAGDVIITHDLLPHSRTKNHTLGFPKVIANPHVCQTQPLQLYREDGDYTLVEQVILHHMGRESIPEFKITRPRESYYPREAFTKRARIRDELERMVAWARKNGATPEEVASISIYRGTPESIKDHEYRHGYELPWGPNEVTHVADQKRRLKGIPYNTQIFSYADTEDGGDLAVPNVDILKVLA